MEPSLLTRSTNVNLQIRLVHVHVACYCPLYIVHCDVIGKVFYMYMYIMSLIIASEMIWGGDLIPLRRESRTKDVQCAQAAELAKLEGRRGGAPSA